MRIAIPAGKNELGAYIVAEHFGRCPYFVVATIENGVVVDKDVIDNPHYGQHVPFAVPGFLAGLEPKPDIIITSGLGPRAIETLESYEIKVISGALGSADQVLEDYINNKLKTSGNICEHL